MQYDAKTPKEYLDQLPDDWRRNKIDALRKIIIDMAPELVEKIDYKMLAYGAHDSIVFHLNAQKNYVSLYVGDASVIDPEGELLKGLSTGKGCIRFTKTVDVSNTRIDEFIKRAIDMWERGINVNC